MEIEAASGSGGGGAVDESKAFSKGTFLVWEDLSAVLPNFGHVHTKRLLQGLNGYAEPGRIMAIMGPSGSGKSTLLDSLAGRLSRKVIMTGNVLLDGKKKRLEYGVADVPNSSDPFMNLATAEIRALLVEKYRCSKYAKRVKARIGEITATKGLDVKKKSGSQATWWKQLTTLTRRSLVNMSRDVGYYWLRIIVYLIVSVCVGTIFFDVGNSYTAILARGACGAFISGFMTFMSIGGFPSFIEEMKVFYRERLNGYYGVAVFIISNFLSSFPFLVAITLTTGTITYHMVKFRPEFSHYVFFCLNIYACIAVIESLMMVVASLVPNFLMGIITGAGIIGILMMTSGFFRLLPDLPKPFWRYPISYLSYGSWAIQGAYKNDLLGLEFDPLIPGEPKLKGDVIITTMFGIQLDHSKWWDLSAIFIILIGYRLIFFAILKFKERASPVFNKIYAKSSLHQLDKRPSFRKVPSLSKRHQPLHSLSSQEGLNSPLH